MDEYSQALVAAVDAVFPGWVERQVEEVMRAAGLPVGPEVREGTRRAGSLARVEVVERLTRLLSADVDAQRTSPLSIVRGAVRYPTAVLRSAGVPPLARDSFEQRAFPDDDYRLTPATWADIDPSLAEPGLIWGAWKAQQHLRRRRESGIL